MTLYVDIPDSLAQQVTELAAAQQVSVDQVVAAALIAQVSASATRPSIKERAQKVNWQKVDDLLARVPDQPPLPWDGR